MDSLRALGERGIISIMEKSFGRSGRTVVGFGDDVAVVRASNRRFAILKTDMLVGSTDMPPGMTFRQAARKAVVANVSDFAAKGVKPYAGLVALGLPRKLTKRDVHDLARGLSSGAKEYGFSFVGGDTSQAEDLIISIALFGEAATRNLILRSGAGVGDFVAVTGDFGSSSAGLRALLSRHISPSRLSPALAQAVYHPNAELGLGVKLAATGAITASIDSSDGFAWSLHEISKMSGRGMRIDNIPISVAAKRFAEHYGYRPSDLALYGGEEYHLVVTVKRSMFGKAQNAAKGRLTIMGVVTKRSEGIRLVSSHGVEEIAMKGWEHFRESRDRHS